MVMRHLSTNRLNMHKYIVPLNRKTSKWFRLFHDVFRDEKHQVPLVTELVEIAASLPIHNEKNKQHTRLGLLLSCMEVVQDLSDTGMMQERDLVYATQVAADIASELAYGLSERSILSNKNTFVFEGFTNMDIVVKVLEEGEIHEAEERIWLTG